MSETHRDPCPGPVLRHGGGGWGGGVISTQKTNIHNELSQPELEQQLINDIINNSLSF